jgi:hypothetical protein
VACCLAALVFAACAQSEGGPDGTGGSASGGSTGSGGVTGSGGATGAGGTSSGGVTGSGGTTGTGGAKGGTTGSGGTSSGGTTGSGGTIATGGTTGSGGTTGTGGAKGGTTGTGGTSTGGATGTGGAKGGTTGSGGTGGATGTGGAKGGTTGSGGASGATGTGGTTGSGGGADAGVTCGGTLPTSGGTQHTGSTQGTAGSLSWSLWMNGSGGSITTYTTPAFSASWGPNSGDFLARIGLQWGSGKAVSALGTVTAEYDETKTGSGGGYSYIGIYGWSVNPCVEWYIVDDSYNTSWPFNPGGTMVTTATIDGGTYNIIQRSTTGTGGNRCGSNVTNWTQFYSIRTTKRTCGTISISQHWAAWAAKNLNLGSVLEASILVEAGGGTGSIQFPTANVTSTP